MGPKRATRASQRTASNLQSKLSFQSKVTKPGVAQHAKAAKKDPALVDDIVKSELPEEETATAQPTADEAEDDAPAPDPLQSHGAPVKTIEVLGGEAKQSHEGAVGGKASGWIGDEEDRARKISDTQIKRYWREKEQERWAPRVHQEDLTVYQKVLREFDITAKYGPCIGIARLKRWKRANMLGLKPPIEVLAVLLKEMDGSNSDKVQRAYVDELMSSRFTAET